MGSAIDPSASSVRLGVSLLTSEANRSILAGLARHPMSHQELKAWLVIASAATLHRHLDALREAAAIRRRQTSGRRRVSYELTAAGQALVGLVALATRWMDRHPRRSLEPTSPIGWRAFAALGTAWDLALIQRLARGPSSGSELSGAVPGLSGDKAERELGRLAGAGIVEPFPGADGRPRQTLSAWGRVGIGVLAAGARWEREHVPQRAVPVTAADGGAALLATLPLISLPTGASGICSFAVEADDAAPPPRVEAIWAEVSGGRIRSAAAGKAPRPPVAWARGSVSSWFEAVIDGRTAAVQTGGELELAPCLRQLHARLYGQ